MSSRDSLLLSPEATSSLLCPRDRPGGRILVPRTPQAALDPGAVLWPQHSGAGLGYRPDTQARHHPVLSSTAMPLPSCWSQET